jgi:hypothetical protein
VSARASSRRPANASEYAAIARMCAFALGRGGRLERPRGGFVELSETNERHRARFLYPEQQRIERAEIARVIGGSDRSLRIARLRVNERERIMGECEIRTEVDRLLEFG